MIPLTSFINMVTEIRCQLREAEDGGKHLHPGLRTEGTGGGTPTHPPPPPSRPAGAAQPSPFSAFWRKGEEEKHPEPPRPPEEPPSARARPRPAGKPAPPAPQRARPEAARTPPEEEQEEQGDAGGAGAGGAERLAAGQAAAPGAAGQAGGLPAARTASDGSKVSDATLMEVLLMNDFKLVINNTAYSVSPPVKDKLSSEHATEMEDIKSLVHRLFVALHLEEHQIRKERELLQKLDHLKEELLPLEQMKARITDSADAKTSRLLWVGLALMSTQGGALAWLTWWVYSWDIMEPVTYFVTYGSAMAFYAYFVLTKRDYIYPDATDRQFLHYFYQKSKKQHFNVERYNKLKEDLAEAEESLKRLRQPLHLRLPIQEISDKD
ncbi:calcium uniporter regulatory subunit MCUb, mitochondrial isoform X1 [Columba livia]|uniref:calcium uniporter regulatory subunit MCUb, mitochondrial isoform X1 n=1 Tax=Columba livia TaxID=8932 RepID=UPI0031BA8F9D